MCRSDRVLDPFELDDVGQDTPCLGVAAVRASPDGSTTSGTEAQSCDWTVPELFLACIRCRSNQRPIMTDWHASMTWA